ncbi:MAG: 4-(cytidine 5'-diphospho)-2-C-methyl-D-erythritol kinase [Gammaproteobacteria bacterium]|nr:MAG: 4-(cytidine 5'-diphospho)-2-C-methyl-D-erythritol kinase [Gammaproteobacteria bacterium]
MDSISVESWPAPGKLNLFLHITGRREDGYHLLQTVFQFFDYGDSLQFEITNNGVISRETEIVGVPPEQDLIIRAAEMLQQRSGTMYGTRIKITKRLPMGGGIGGGSSDAATTLVALNRLWQIGLSTQELAEMGLKLGADVPVFIHGRACWAEGVGELITPIELDEPWYIILKPQCEVPTKDIFSDSALTRDTTYMKMPAFQEELGNDCEAVVRKRFPLVSQALDWLSQYGKAKLTGTGACMFAAYNTKEEAQKVLDKKPDWLEGFIAKGLNYSPLQSKL